MEIYKDILNFREKFLKNFNVDEVKEYLKDVEIKDLPVIDNLSDEKVLKIIDKVNPAKIVIKIFEKYNIDIKDFDFSDFENTMIKVMEGEEVDVEDEILDIYDIVMRIYGLPYTVIWKALKDKIDLSQFDENYCPVCGANFDYAYIDENGQKYLVCDLCRFPWRYPRIKCPICENEDQEKIFYYQFEKDYEFVRIYKCEECGEVHKVLLIDKIKKYPSVEIANIETIPLEFAIEDENEKQD